MAKQAPAFGLKYHARAIAPVVAETSTSKWITGTNALSEENEVEVLVLDSKVNQLKLAGAYTHQHEIWCIAPSPSDPSKLITAHNTGRAYEAALWAIPEEGRDLTQEAKFPGSGQPIRGIQWQGSGQSQVIILDEGCWQLFDIGSGSEQAVHKAEVGSSLRFQASSWSGNEPSKLCTSHGTCLQVWDLRDRKVAEENAAAHAGAIRDVDFAQGDSNYLASAGDDCATKVWDVRKFTAPIHTSCGHSHWVWQVKFNPVHDQLLLSSSSDATVNLQQLSCLAKKAQPRSTRMSPATLKTSGAKDASIETYHTHEDSVYGVAWSSADPWTFASLSHDGRIAVNTVPSNMKYSILL